MQLSFKEQDIMIPCSLMLEDFMGENLSVALMAFLVSI